MFEVVAQNFWVVPTAIVGVGIILIIRAFWRGQPPYKYKVPRQ